MINSVKVDAYNDIYEATTTDNTTTMYTDSNVPDEVIAFIQNEEICKESLSSAVCIYSA